MNEELKPCPFCGGREIQSFTEVTGFNEPYRKFRYYISCKDCEAHFFYSNFENQAIEAWNKRA